MRFSTPHCPPPCSSYFSLSNAGGRNLWRRGYSGFPPSDSEGREEPEFARQGRMSGYRWDPGNISGQPLPPPFYPRQDGFRRSKSWPPAHSERFRLALYNILPDYLARDNRSQLYFHIPPRIMDWEWRKHRILIELQLWSPDILCLQEVDRFQDLEKVTSVKGYHGIWKMRTGIATDRCASFWRTNRHSLREKAFSLLTIRSYSAVGKDLLAQKVVQTLKRFNGFYGGSEMQSLIRSLCNSNAKDLAAYVVNQTDNRTSYYNLIIAAMCRHRSELQGAMDMFSEMKRLGCSLTVNTYNYLLGSLFKNNHFAEGCQLLQEMEKVGCLPDLVTFEIVAVHACRVNKMDFAVKVIDEMLLEGLKPRLTTHAVLIKSFFYSGRLIEAHNYVVDMSVRDCYSANMNYSLLARLFFVSRRLVKAGEILDEMMEKGLKPNFRDYLRVVKGLYKTDGQEFAFHLKVKFSKFSPVQIGDVSIRDKQDSPHYINVTRKEK